MIENLMSSVNIGHSSAVRLALSKMPPRPPIGGTALTGFLVILAGLGGFIGWAATAPLASAAVAHGVVAVDSNRKTIQHLEGGLIAEILVHEGDRIEAGKPLLRLDGLEARALHAMLERQYVAYAAEEARLLAEREDMPTLRFPAGIEAHRARSDLAELLGGQERIFVSGRVALDGQIAVLQQKIAQLAAQIAGIQAQLKSGETQLALITDELSGVRDLVEKGLEKRPRLLALERSAAELKGRQGEYTNRIAQVREGIAEAEMQILNARQARVEKAANEVREVQSRRSEFEERLSEAAVKLERRDVLAPQAGTVLNLRYHTVGGVVAPGAPILDIVPGEDRLIVEAKVSPLDIDVVHPGLTARISLTAYKSRTTPQITGSVLQVSADTLTEEHTGRSYFLARIAIDPVELAKLPDVTLTPGMPADTFIETGARTLLQYLIQPITDSFRRAFRET